jgi:DNA-binding transcriptional LysR family regulator
MRGVSLDQLRSFAQVVELGSFSAAAERLKLTQPAVSLQVKQLERRLGVRLIERVGRQATATAAGADLLTYARQIDSALSGALDAMAHHSSAVTGRVRLATGATACIYVLPPILRELRRRFPSLEIVVSTGNTSDILKLLEENALDLGLVTLPAPGRMFEVTPLLEDEFVAIASVEIHLSAKVSPAALAKLPVVLYEPAGRTRRIVDEWFRRAGVSLKPVMELGSVEAIKQLVGAGLGAAVLPGMAVRDLGEGDAIAARPLSPRLSRTLAVVVRRDKLLTRGLREVIEALKRLKPPP